MARKKLFGNTRDPRCETCMHGRRSSDGDAVLCRRGGVLPLSHHCRHFRYDPLRRTPNRVRPLEEFDAAEFALDDLSAEWLETVAQKEPSPEDIRHEELMKKLRAYLDETPSPNVDDILILLNETPITAVDTETLLAEADSLLEKPADEAAPSVAPPKEEQAPGEVATPAVQVPTTVPTSAVADFSDLEQVLDAVKNTVAKAVAIEPLAEAVEILASEEPSATEVAPEIHEISIIEETPDVEEPFETEKTLTIEGLSESEQITSAEETFEIDAALMIDATFEEESAPTLEEMPVAVAPQTVETAPAVEKAVAIDKPTVIKQPKASPAQKTATPAPTTWHSDSSLDITGDLERLTVNVVQSSTPAAFRLFDLKLDDGNQPEEERDDIELAENDTFTEDALITTPQGSDYDDETLRAEDLIFLSEMQLTEEDDSEIGMNADGTFTQF